MLTFDMFTIIGLISVAVVVTVMITLCKLKGCNKPIC